MRYCLRSDGKYLPTPKHNEVEPSALTSSLLYQGRYTTSVRLHTVGTYPEANLGFQASTT
jgi:hypothetical protein